MDAEREAKARKRKRNSASSDQHSQDGSLRPHQAPFVSARKQEYSKKRVLKYDIRAMGCEREMELDKESIISTTLSQPTGIVTAIEVGPELCTSCSGPHATSSFQTTFKSPSPIPLESELEEEPKGRHFEAEVSISCAAGKKKATSQRKKLKKERKERKRRRIRFLKSINAESDRSTGYCSTALESLTLTVTSSSSSSGIEADIESLGKKTVSDEESNATNVDNRRNHDIHEGDMIEPVASATVETTTREMLAAMITTIVQEGPSC